MTCSTFPTGWKLFSVYRDCFFKMSPIILLVKIFLDFTAYTKRLRKHPHVCQYLVRLKIHSLNESRLRSAGPMRANMYASNDLIYFQIRNNWIWCGTLVRLFNLFNLGDLKANGGVKILLTTEMYFAGHS